MYEPKKYAVSLSLIVLFTLFLFFIDSHLETAMSQQTSSAHHQFTVVIDAGHGGFDSGKVGIDGTLEKDMNLLISKKLKTLLESCDIRVIMTRTEDTSLSSEGSSNQKRQDMQARATLMNNAAPDCIISIHQNSYTEESIDGAQVFYYTPSNKGKTLAALIQQSLIKRADPSNHRKEKSNDSYFLLKQAQAPIVIVECGFLSNRKECKKIKDDTYQQQLAWAIHMGILQYLNGVAI